MHVWLKNGEEILHILIPLLFGYSLLRIIDPWGETLRYDYYDDYTEPDEARNFPVITSAGPDGVFGTDDDIASR